MCGVLMGARPGRTSGVRTASGVVSGSNSHHTWITTAALLVVAGVVASAFGAGVVARDNGARAHQAFLSSSAEIASTLQLAILHEQDLNVSATGFISGRAAASNRQFGQWATSVSALTRYPELIGFGQVLKV